MLFTEADENNTEETEHDAETTLVQYPDNLNVKDIFYFIFAPTLCYELNFPRTQRIRKRFLLKRIFEVVVGIQIIFAVMQQYMIPSVKNSLIPFSNMDVTKATERLLKLAVGLRYYTTAQQTFEIFLLLFSYQTIWHGCVCST